VDQKKGLFFAELTLGRVTRNTALIQHKLFHRPDFVIENGVEQWFGGRLGGCGTPVVASY
jgi:hypothetical protein